LGALAETVVFLYVEEKYRLLEMLKEQIFGIAAEMGNNPAVLAEVEEAGQAAS
jgi:hypothetical protein